jgi:hypothetical protein
MATYSEHGPRRCFSTDAHGVKHYDNLIKPDLVAPGNKIVSAEAANNYLVRTHPELETNNYPTANMKLMLPERHVRFGAHGCGRGRAAPGGESQPDAKHGEGDSDVHGATAGGL